MTPERIFLGTASDATALTAAWCRNRWPDALPPGLVLCVPTALAGRRLRDALADLYGAYQGVRFLTPALLITLFAPPKDAEAATETETLLAWERVFAWLRGEGAESLLLSELFPGERNWLAQAPSRLAVARRLNTLRGTLAEAALDFGRVAAAPDALPEGHERLRWQALDLLETRYREELAAHSLTDPCDLQQATIESHTLLPQEAGPLRVVMACVPDFLPALTGLLDVMPEVTVLIAAERDEAAFDTYGRPNPTFWNDPDRQLSVATESIRRCEKPEGAAAVAERFLNGFGALSPGQLCFGILDRNMMPQLTAMALRHGMTVFEPEPLPILAQPEGRALSALLAYAAEGPTEATLTALADIPETAATLEPAGYTQTALRNELADLRNALLPTDVRALLAASEEDRPAIHALVKKAEAWRAALAADTVLGVRAFLNDLWGTKTLHPTAAPLRFAAFEAIGDLLRELADCRVTGKPDAALFAARLSDLAVRPVRRGADASFEGRLELLWSPADIALIGGVSETLFPDSLLSDPFLPDGLRTALGMRDDATRAARDAYILDTLCKRYPPNRVCLICADTNPDGNALRPSRLLFRCTHEERRDRVRKLFIDSPESRPTPPPVSGLRLRAKPEAWRKWQLLTRFSASAVAAFLRSPADYFLHFVLGLREPLGRPDGDLPPTVFGNLVHSILRCLKTAADDDLLRSLEACCDRVLSKAYGPVPTVASLALARDIERRLRGAATWEQTSREEGWRVAETEYRMEASILVDGTPVTLVGRADRIDRHPDGRWRIVDYKTTLRAKKADNMHYRINGETPDTPDWIGFQVPIYTWMLSRCHPEHPAEEKITGGYLFLPGREPPAYSAFTDPVSPEATQADLRRTLSQMLRIGDLIREPKIAEGCSDPLLAELIRRCAEGNPSP